MKFLVLVREFSLRSVVDNGHLILIKEIFGFCKSNACSAISCYGQCIKVPLSMKSKKKLLSS